MYTKTSTKLPGVIILEPQVFSDERGWFMESYNYRDIEETAFNTFLQDNQSYTKYKNTIRGIHFQNHPYAQAKLVRVLKGAVIDVAVDLREGSPYYKQYAAVELSDQNKKQLFIPKGFGHAFLTLTDDVEFFYKCDDYYNKESERGIRWNDPDINIDWKELGLSVDEPILSEKDKNAPLLKNSDCNFPGWF